ncbi:unnamed protein product [Eruca vesicaria subsp. sativa]|uniref:WRKY domain-containing protein n=1 Tax=Eruca vesicaria subsp. sativa TaxID=29727 RepID=A0ABC8LU62_ERUVS|nr:unnamed protein product [Eruca vesicaria subsp. sativa]
MVMEEKLVINELEQGRELAKRLMSNLKDTSSVESNKTLISEILSIYQNAISRLSSKEGDKNIILKRSRDIDDKDSKNMFKKRKVSEKKTEKVSFFVGAGQEKGSIDDGYCWRKYGQKEIHGSINPRGYFRCTHRFTQKCLAVKQVQKSDRDPSIFEVKYVGSHTCNNATTSPKTATTNSSSVSMFLEGNRVAVTEQKEDIKPTKTEEVMMSLEDLESKKNIFRTFSFSNYEFENAGGWKGNIFQENLSPATTSGSGITSEFVTAPASVENSETADSYFSTLDNIIEFGQDWLWS